MLAFAEFDPPLAAAANSGGWKRRISWQCCRGSPRRISAVKGTRMGKPFADFYPPVTPLLQHLKPVGWREGEAGRTAGRATGGLLHWMGIAL